MVDQMVTAPPHGAGLDSASATESILQRLAKTADNMEFLETLHETNL
jgi:transcription termination factor Rho